MDHFPINKLLIPDFQFFQVKRQRLVSTFGNQLQTGTVYDPLFNKCVSIGAGETRTLAAVDGPGLIVRIYFTLPIRYRTALLRNLILRIFFDDTDFPSVEAPLGDFFCLPFGTYTSYSSFFLSCTSGGYLCQFPMPFSRGARVELENRSGGRAHMIFFQMNYFELSSLDSTCPRFMAGFRRENPTRDGVPYTLLERSGQGWYVGCNLQVQAREPFLFKPLLEIPWPQGLGMGTLEGPERVFVDAESTPSLHGTGHEEFFNAAWYFTNPKDTGIFSGNIYRSYFKGRVAAFRQHFIDPIPFSTGIRVEIDHGFANRIRSDYTSCAYWYQQGTTIPLSALPKGSLRPSRWLPHAAQMAALVLVGPVAVLASLPGFLRFIRRARLAPRNEAPSTRD